MLRRRDQKQSHANRARTGLIPLLLCLSLTAHEARANKLGRATAKPDGGSCGAQLSCRVGETRTYDYDAVFVSEADVETNEESGYAASTMTGDALVSVTAIASQDSLCTYAVNLADVNVAEIVREEVVESAGERELASFFQDTYYFTQSADGQIVDVTLGREEVPEVATFKRGVINSLNVTLRPGKEYQVVESDITGTYTASYEASPGGGHTQLERSATRTGETNLKKGLPPITFETTQATSFTLDESTCVLSQVNIDEVVIIDQPDASDPPVSRHYHHETITVRAAANITLLSTSRSTKVRALGMDRNRDDMVTLPVNARVGLSAEDNEEAVSGLLAQLLTDADNKLLYRALSRAVRADGRGVDYLRSFLETRRPSGRLAQGIASLLISLGSPQAQAVLVEHFLAGGSDNESRERILGLSTLIDEPGEDLVAAAGAISNDASAGSWSAATLALGAYADKLRDLRPELATEIVDALGARLAAAGHGDDAVLFLRALGNAGAQSTLDRLAGYLASDDALIRQSAVIAMRKIDSPRVEQILLGHAPIENSLSVGRAIQRVAGERSEKGLGGGSGMNKGLPVDWDWTETYGGNVASATFSASAMVASSPYLVDVQAGAVGQVFGNEFDIVDVQLLTEEVNATDRRFLFFIMLAGNEIANVDETETCSVTAEDTLWDESISLLDVTTPPIPIIGPLTLSFTLDLDLEFYVNFFRAGDWCTANSDLQMGLTPGVVLEADGYATLTLIIVRGGVGIAGTLIGIEFPTYADAEMEFQDAPTVCFKIDAQLLVADMELYAWGQFNTFIFGWQPNPRPRWTLWEFNLNPEPWNLLTACGDDPALHCLPDVFWWDSSTIDAWWDSANCFVTTPPSGSQPFIASNAYYIQEDATCPAGMPWDGTGCVESNIIAIPGVNVSLFPGPSVVILHFQKVGNFGPIPPCPSGWTTEEYVPGQSRTCSRLPPPGYSTSDFFLVTNGPASYTVYVDGSATCTDGILDTTGCWLGNAPGGMTAFLWSGNFYYAEP